MIVTIAVNKVDKTIPLAINSLFSFISIKKTSKFKTDPKAITFPNIRSDFIISKSENKLNLVNKNRYNDAPTTVQMSPRLIPRTINFLYITAILFVLKSYKFQLFKMLIVWCAVKSNCTGTIDTNPFASAHSSVSSPLS